MRKVDFIKKFKTDFAFRAECRAKGIRVIQDNVIFFNSDGTVRGIAGLTSSKPRKKKIKKI